MKKRMTLFKLIIVVSLFLLIFLTPGVALAEADDELKPNPAAERWILEQVREGKSAYLYTQFPKEKDRAVRAEFLIDLLDNITKDPVVARQGICVNGMIVVGDVIFDNRDINFSVNLPNIVFENNFSVCRSHFYKTFSLIDGHFKGTVNLCGTIVDDTLFLNNAIFDKGADASGLETGNTLSLPKAVFNNSEYAANFNDMNIGKDFDFRSANFNGKANFSQSVINEHMNANDTVFGNSNENISFENLFVGETFFLNRAVFNGPASFKDAHVGKHFVANEIKFDNPDASVGFDMMYVGMSTYLNSAVFNGGVSFNRFKGENFFSADDAQFNNTEHTADFIRMEVNDFISMNRSVFNSPVDFRQVVVNADFNLIGSKFNGSEKEAMFQDMIIGKNLNFSESVLKSKVDLGQTRVGNSILFKKAVIGGPIDLRYVRIGQNLEATDAQFNDIEEGAYFENMEVMDNVLINQAKFAGPADFNYIHVGGSIIANDSQFYKPANFSNMAIGKHVFINRSVFADSVNFTSTSLKGFLANNTTFPQDSGMIDVRGLTYTELDVKDAVSGGRFIFLLNQSYYSGRAYKALEDYYRLEGFPSYADEIYINYKFRETTDGLTFTSWQWWWNIFLGGFIIFGKGPELALIWFVLIVGFGYLMFRKKEKMAAKIETDKPYKPFLYSLDLFLPIINLGFANVWSPKPENRITKIYAVVHRYLGLILIPIAILAFLGIIK